MRGLDGITDSMDTNLSKLWETVKDREGRRAKVQGSQRVGRDFATEQQRHTASILGLLRQRMFSNLRNKVSFFTVFGKICIYLMILVKIIILNFM